ncbi:polysaccharide deacetylase family protein [Thermoactinospora rubra]|uniref:polysaccharide deacetylase family protein n=1 Tax=Thermoactinospora rubra TaxID=1088767 RepID=UPI000A0F560A|nr:polysaccharide deacetylase family protein [Thermoactinospora rubra]
MRVRVVIALALLAGCGSQQPAVKPVAQQDEAAKVRQAKLAKAAAAAKVKANELGQIPVLMYHRIVDKPDTDDDRTPAKFRADLERLAREGYVPITAAEYVTGKIDIPAGKHPVVLTFDDSSPSQLTLDELGTVKPNTAVAILREVAAQNPGFRPVATFYVTRDMFGKTTVEEQAQMLRWLKDNGFDIGNHTHDHLNLRGRPQREVVKQIDSIQRKVKKLAGVDPVTLALPYGNHPSKKAWAQKAGSYEHKGLFLAGYTPGQSPFSVTFDPMNIPRIKAMERKGDCAQFCSHAWLDWLQKNPDMRYTSDGDATTVAYPKFKMPYLRKAFADKGLPY